MHEKSSIVLLFSVILSVFRITYCDWVSDWMVPLQSEIQDNSARRSFNANPGDNIFGGVYKIITTDGPAALQRVTAENAFKTRIYDEQKTAELKMKLKNIIKSAQELADNLKLQIETVSYRENMLKEAIANGRSGVSTLTVSTSGRTVSSNYIIRDGFWTLCNGVVQTPVLGESSNLFSDLFAAPRCIGQEISSSPDPCVFNSLIKYEIVPSRRGMEYNEEQYLCLRQMFNTSLEQYLSVPKRLINETCKDGEVRSVASNSRTCGARVLAEYAYYPHRGAAAGALPLHYCAGRDGACRLLAAWHVADSAVERFEFLKAEPDFKKYFIKTDGYVDRVI